MTKSRASNFTSRKQELQAILQRRDFEALLAWAKKHRNPIRSLISFQFNPDPLICMRAVEALGKVAVLYDPDDLETLRKAIGRFFWMMNDESGNVGWYSAESIGEILHNVPALIPEYAHMLPSFLVEEPFEKGTRIAIARVAQIDKSPFDVPTCKKLVQSLKDPNPEIRGSSLIALKALQTENIEDRVKKLLDDKSKVQMYNFATGNLEEAAIAELAGKF